MAMATTTAGAMACTMPQARHYNAAGICGRVAAPRACPRPISRSHALGSTSAGGFRPLRAVATADPTASSSPSSAVQQKKQYHFLLANAKFMLDEEEHLQELLRERLRNYDERNKEQDFWLVIEPKFVEKFPEMSARLNRPAVALVSTDPVWITFMKLRIDRVLKGVIEAESLSEVAESNPIDVQFDRPDKWTAPYPKYETGWWTPFLPPK
ncbi:uncharacterized protein LOC9655488 [Selaginella moellendorffii]|uniref:uncharacterized protein LOC9655488 n=1 Tax=Selaginella moellendorffii TaxID=88036 RepID=UPI000D1C8104|nr:uncharacterized protein LOC9655488 [Selaginella moellendorffii]|eukprot:XP_002963493.2 uncharacterized protein LOC9655488 [Selaginella moellendorffii]